MHLPYIKKIFKNQDIELLPLMVGQIPMDKLSIYAQALLEYFLDDETVFIVSSDFCHWGERFDFVHQYPDEKPIYESIEKLDRCGMEKIESQSCSNFKQYLDET